MKKTTEKVSYLNYCLYICGVMKDDDFHRTKTKPNEKLLLLKLKNGKAYAKHLLFKQLCQFYKGGGYFFQPFFLSLWFSWTVSLVAMLCFRQLKQIYLQNKIIIIGI